MNEAPTCQECGGPLVEMSADVEATLVGCPTGDCGHEHDDNCVGRVAWCAAGHRTLLGLLRRCNDQEPQRSWGYDVGDTTPGCDWHGRETCHICRPHPKLDAWPDLPIRPRHTVSRTPR